MGSFLEARRVGIGFPLAIPIAVADRFFDRLLGTERARRVSGLVEATSVFSGLQSTLWGAGRRSIPEFVPDVELTLAIRQVC